MNILTVFFLAGFPFRQKLFYVNYTTAEAWHANALRLQPPLTVKTGGKHTTTININPGTLALKSLSATCLPALTPRHAKQQNKRKAKAATAPPARKRRHAHPPFNTLHTRHLQPHSKSTYKRLPFTLQKVTFEAVKGHLSDAKRRPFAKPLHTTASLKGKNTGHGQGYTPFRPAPPHPVFQ